MDKPRKGHAEPIGSRLQCVHDTAGKIGTGFPQVVDHIPGRRTPENGAIYTAETLTSGWPPVRLIIPPGWTFFSWLKPPNAS